MKKNIVWLLFAVIILFSVFSCAKLPLYESKKLSVSDDETISNHGTPYYDKKSYTRFQIANNDSFLFIQATFNGRESLMKIMQGGLILSFDPERKKNSDYQLKIERSEKSKIQSNGNMQPARPELTANTQNLPKFIGLNFNKVTWSKNGNEFVFYRDILKEPIRVDFWPNEQNELTLNLKIPLNELHLAKNQNIFSLGFETGKTAFKNKEQTAGRNVQGGSRGMGAGGGRKGGGGGMRGGSNGGMHSGGAYQSAISPLEFWIQVHLN